MNTIRLPPLNSLKAFEAAGRQESFLEAAAEQSVTSGSISRHVRLLEMVDWGSGKAPVCPSLRHDFRARIRSASILARMLRRGVCVSAGTHSVSTAKAPASCNGFTPW